jgi:hypothetical protein
MGSHVVLFKKGIFVCMRRVDVLEVPELELEALAGQTNGTKK